MEELFLSAVECTWDNDVRQIEIYTAKPLVPEPSGFQVEMAVEKLKRHISPGADQMPAELIKAGGRTVCSEIYKHIYSNWYKEELLEPVYKKGNKTD